MRVCRKTKLFLSLPLAAIFQHNPSILMTLADSNLSTPQDLINKKNLVNNGNYAAIISMFKKEGIGHDKINITKNNLDYSLLENKKMMQSLLI